MAIAVALDHEVVGIAGEAVDGGLATGWIGEGAEPLVGATVGGDDDGSGTVALGEDLEIISHVYPAGSTDKFGPELTDRTVTTLTYAVGDETRAVAALFAR